MSEQEAPTAEFCKDNINDPRCSCYNVAVRGCDTDPSMVGCTEGREWADKVIKGIPISDKYDSDNIIVNSVGEGAIWITNTNGNLINVLGADHTGYISRINAAVRALSNEKSSIDTKVCALVNLLEDGKPIKMSKRAGNFVTLSEIVEAVGKDVIRFIMLTRRNDQTLDFDFKKVTEKSKENPVFYVQYAHARCNSIFKSAKVLIIISEPDNFINYSVLVIIC